MQVDIFFILKCLQKSSDISDCRAAQVLIHFRERLIRHRKWVAFFTRMSRIQMRMDMVHGANSVTACYHVSSTYTRYFMLLSHFILSIGTILKYWSLDYFIMTNCIFIYRDPK